MEVAIAVVVGVEAEAADGTSPDSLALEFVAEVRRHSRNLRLGPDPWEARR